MGGVSVVDMRVRIESCMWLDCRWLDIPVPSLFAPPGAGPSPVPVGP